MKVFIRVISLLLVLLMLVPAVVSCNKPDDDKAKGDASDTVASTELKTEDEANTKLPQINWEGREYRILGKDASTPVFENFEVDRDEMPEDVVGMAVFNRNVALMEKYGIDVVGTFSGNPFAEAQVFVDAGDDLYDLIICPNSKMQQFGTSGKLINMRGLEYIDLEHDCWNDYANEQLTFGGKLYYTTNKFLLQDKHRTWIVWYNRTLAKELNVGNLEREVFDGTWTMDKYIEIARTCAAETDGSDGMTSEDTWGVTLSATAQFSVLLYSCGFRLSDMQSDGYPALVGATDQMMSIVDKVMELTGDTTTCFVESFRPTAEDSSVGAATIFREGRSVTMIHAVSWFSNLYRLSFEYGVLPTPKYDEKQDSYHCFPNPPNGTLFAIPSTINDISFAGFGLQALSEESVETSYTEYVETKCKLQIAFDEDMAKCLNIIFDNIVYDIAFLDNYGGLADVLNSIVKESSNIYGRQYSKYERRAKAEIKKVTDAYAALPY